MTEAGSNAPKASARTTAIKPASAPVVPAAQAAPVAKPAAVAVKAAPVAKIRPVVKAKAKAKVVAKAKPVVGAKRIVKAKPAPVAKAAAAKVAAPVAIKTMPAPIPKIQTPKIETVASPAVVQEKLSDISSAAPLAAVLQEGSKQMATKVETGADKVQAVFGDAQARIKTAWDKQSKFGEELIELAKGNVEAVVASARLAAKHGEELGQEAADYSKKSFENAIALFRSFASAKSPTELFQLQSDFAKSSFDSAVAETSKVSEKLLKVAGDVAQPISNRYAVAAEKLKATF